MESWEALLERELPAYGYRPEAAAVARLGAFLAQLAEANRRMRLVGSAEPGELVRRHLGESLYLGALVDLGSGPLVDLGSGAGFPGLGLALGWPELKTTLVEATGKKAAYLSAVVEGLGLGGQVTVWPGFLERRWRPGQPNPLRGARWVTVRALEKMDGVPGWLGGWMEPEAQAAFWVGRAKAEAWRTGYEGWSWSEFHPLPGARERGIVLGRPKRNCSPIVPRETKTA